MALEQSPRSSAVLAGGTDGTGPAEAIVSQRSAAVQDLGGAAAGPWPSWAVPQLRAAIAIAQSVDARMSLATRLYREWFNPVAGHSARRSERRPLAGVYRAAHAGSTARRGSGPLSVVQRHDVVRVDGWWRTWGEYWTPPRSRPGSVRLLFTPRPDRLAEFVGAVTGALLDERLPWSLGCAIDPHRISRYGCAVLDLPDLEAVPAGLFAELAPLLHPVAPPLSLPLGPGIGAVEYPDNGMTFGEHRCHLVALALRHPTSAGKPLRSIAAVFAAHGIDPAQPHRTGGLARRPS